MDAPRPPPFDPRTAVRALKRADPELGTRISRIGPCRLALMPSVAPFPTLVRSIVFQQLSGKAARTIHDRMLTKLDGPLSPEALLAASVQRLRGAGLSRAKVAAVRDLAAKVEDGTVPGARALARLADEEVIARLTEVRGIGRWTAQMYMMFSLGRPDVLAVGDLGIQKGFRKAFGMTRLPAAVTLERRAERWRPWRTVACWYLWRIADATDDAW